MKVSIKKLEARAKIPSYAHNTDAGMDLYYCGPDTVLAPGARGVFQTGLAMAIPKQYVGLIWDKSGIATQFGLKVMGGVVDAGYRGEIMVCLTNTTPKEYTIMEGQKIAQMLIQPVVSAEIIEVDNLPGAEDDRGEGGFGSTGLS